MTTLPAKEFIPLSTNRDILQDSSFIINADNGALFPHKTIISTTTVPKRKHVSHKRSLRLTTFLLVLTTLWQTHQYHEESSTCGRYPRRGRHYFSLASSRDGCRYVVPYVYLYLSSASFCPRCFAAINDTRLGRSNDGRVIKTHIWKNNSIQTTTATTFLFEYLACDLN